MLTILHVSSSSAASFPRRLTNAATKIFARFKIDLGGMGIGLLCGLSTMERLPSDFFGMEESCWSQTKQIVIRFLGLILSIIGSKYSQNDNDSFAAGSHQTMSSRPPFGHVQSSSLPSFC